MSETLDRALQFNAAEAIIKAKYAQRLKVMSQKDPMYAVLWNQRCDELLALTRKYEDECDAALQEASHG
jgi:hypothetical protein